MMGTGSGGGIIFLIIGIVGSVIIDTQGGLVYGKDAWKIGM